ncbi:MAG: hypothetical protein V4671_32895, partial [Armatimonadota bacterium]
MASGRRRRFGYAGWFADLIGLIVLLVVLLWGIHKWNAASKHPLGLPDIPLPGAARKLPAPLQRWLSGTVLSSTLKPDPRPTETPVVPVAAPSPPSVPPVSAPEPSPSTEATLEPPAASASPDPAAEAPPVMAVVTTLKTAVRPSPNPLLASATALCQKGSLLCMGLADGGIAIRDGSKGIAGIVVPLPKPAGPVRSVAISPDGGRVWWLAGDSLVYSYDRKPKTLRSIALPSGGPAEAVSVLPGDDGGTVAVLGGGTAAARFFDGDTGRLREPAEILPLEAAEAISQP